MIKGAVGFVAIFVAFGICCMELKIQCDRYVYAVQDSWIQYMPEREKNGVVSLRSVYAWQAENGPVY